MNLQTKEAPTDDLSKTGGQVAIERAFLEAYLRPKGYKLADLANLPEEQAKTLMTEASQYASLRLAQIESTAHFREKLHHPE